MRVLIVHANTDLEQIWQTHLNALGATVISVCSGADALVQLQSRQFDVILLDLVLPDANSIAVADFASFNQPRANVVFVTDTDYFSDGSIFAHIGNARAFVETKTPPNDLAAIVHHYGLSAKQAAAR